MLAKVAERIYWTARYLERIENTARIINVYDQLLYDLPTEVNISWYSLIELSGLEPTYKAIGDSRLESDVVHFLISDTHNPGSIICNLNMIRENVRTTRDVLPEQTWEQVNEFSHYLKTHLADGKDRKSRHSFLKHIVGRCQRLHGLLYSSMSRDNAWHFLCLGRDLERADMATRTVESGATALIVENGDASINLHQVVWGHVLRSAEASGSYRKTIQGPVSGEDVTHFMLSDDQFPRSAAFSLRSIQAGASILPRGDKLSEQTLNILINSLANSAKSRTPIELREYLDGLQIEINELHWIITKLWFGYQQFELEALEVEQSVELAPIA